MELDKRIIEGKRPLTCFDTEQAKEFLGKECYFSNCKVHYKNLSAFEKFESLTDYCIGTLTAIMDLGDRVFDVDQQCKVFMYCLPCEWVKPEEPEKKYRPFTLNEFLVTFPMLTDITMREKGDNDCIITCTVTAYRTKIMSADICLGVEWISLKELFDKCEYKNTLGDWIPFGEEIEE